MSLTFVISNPRGLILAADSRQSYTNSIGATRIGSENAVKIFKISKYFGMTVAGIATLYPNGFNSPSVGIETVISEFINSDIQKNNEINAVAKSVYSYLLKQYNPKQYIDQYLVDISDELNKNGFKKIKNGIKIADDLGNIEVKYYDKNHIIKSEIRYVPQIFVLITGYDENSEGKKIPRVARVDIPGKVTDNAETENQFVGIRWSGQSELLNRVILGYDYRLFQIPELKTILKTNSEQNFRNILSNLEYNISWQTIALQDSIDLAELLIKTTAAFQRFSDGIMMVPAEIPGVGGPIDIAVIDPEQGFGWFQKKEIKLNFD
jgi:hypothetical protein